jgi:hypothetical protein
LYGVYQKTSLAIVPSVSMAFAVIVNWLAPGLSVLHAGIPTVCAFNGTYRKKPYWLLLIAESVTLGGRSHFVTATDRCGDVRVLAAALPSFETT